MAFTLSWIILSTCNLQFLVLAILNAPFSYDNRSCRVVHQIRTCGFLVWLVTIWTWASLRFLLFLFTCYVHFWSLAIFNAPFLTPEVVGWHIKFVHVDSLAEWLTKHEDFVIIIQKFSVQALNEMGIAWAQLERVGLCQIVQALFVELVEMGFIFTHGRNHSPSDCDNALLSMNRLKYIHLQEILRTCPRTRPSGGQNKMSFSLLPWKHISLNKKIVENNKRF